MRYIVKAQPRPDLTRFWHLLNDGTIDNQEPDGKEIVAAMRRAVIKGNTTVWYETCYCNPPLNHERSTIYDRFFTHMRIEPADTLPRLEGARFWDYLRSHSTEMNNSGAGFSKNPRVNYVPIRAL